MNLPPPTPQQARIVWAAVTGLALAILVALMVGVVWGLSRVLDVLSPVLWPIAVAGVLAYLLDPVVDFFERRRVPRTRAIVLVFFVALFLVLGVFSSVVPRLVVESRDLAVRVPTYVAKLEDRAMRWVNNPPAPLQNLLRRFGVEWRHAPTTTSLTPSEVEGMPADLHGPLDTKGPADTKAPVRCSGRLTRRQPKEPPSGSARSSRRRGAGWGGSSRG